MAERMNSLLQLKIEAQIDEHYIDRVTPGLAATFERQSATFNASLRKVYPEVRDGKFKADFKFEGEVPENIRIGRQNPQYYEALEGLEPGEKVITSGYDSFGDNEVLILQ